MESIRINSEVCIESVIDGLIRWVDRVKASEVCEYYARIFEEIAKHLRSILKGNNMSKQAPNTTGLHVQIDSDLYDAFAAAVPANDRTHTIERLLARMLKRKPPAERRRGRPKKTSK